MLTTLAKLFRSFFPKLQKTFKVSLRDIRKGAWAPTDFAGKVLLAPTYFSRNSEVESA